MSSFDEKSGQNHSGLSSATPVQIVKPTLRLDKEASSCAKTTENFNYVPMGLSTTNNKEQSIAESFVAISDHNEPEVGEDEPEFEWNDYLDSTGSVAAPPTSFPHVENSLQTLFTQDMKLEIPNRQIADSYWVASVVMTCGPLLRLRYEGYDNDRSEDFWCEIASGEIHPLGWCAFNNKRLEPPPAIKHKHDDWDEYLRKSLCGATTVPEYLLEANGCTAVDQMKQGMKLEIQEQYNPSNVWIATILENVGGRLLLRYDGVQTSCNDFWLFYLSLRCHPLGWTKENELCHYRYPSGLPATLTPDESNKLLTEVLKDSAKTSVPSIIFKHQEKIPTHNFKVGMKLEAVHPTTLLDICPATVTQVLNSSFFQIEIDGEGAPVQTICCHAASQNIFPVGWAQSNGLTVTSPKGWQPNRTEWSWDDYLKHCSATDSGQRPVEPAPAHLFKAGVIEHGFEKEMKLEAVNVFQPHQICAATIEKLVANLMWIRLDNSHSLQPSHAVPVNSYEIFPVGWCDSNGYPLKIPLTFQQGMKKSPSKKVAIVMPKKQKRKMEGTEEKEKEEEQVETNDNYDFAKGIRGIQATGKAWCPEIYINYKCFSGPFLSKARIAGLPRHVGPGPVTLVLKEIISMIVSVSYQSSRALSVLQSPDEPTPGMQKQLIKAKYKGKTYRAMVEIIQNSDKVGDYCRHICKQLQCCPNLFGPNFIGDKCPENCYTLTKTKNPIKRGKKRKKNKVALARKPSVSPTGGDVQEEREENNNGAKPKPEEENPDVPAPPKEKRKYVHKIIPKSDIVTRGAKLPNFALELRRRRRKSVTQSFVSRLTKSIHRKSANIPPLRPSNLGLAATEKGDAVAEQICSGIATKTSSNGHYTILKQECPSPAASSSSSTSVLTATATPVTKTATQVIRHILPPCPTMPELITTVESQSQAVPGVLELLHLDTNPLKWTVEEVATFIKGTDCAQMARLLKEQEIDGQAMLLLTLPTIQEHMEMKLGPAIKLCHHIERVKLAFYSQFAN